MSPSQPIVAMNSNSETIRNISIHVAMINYDIFIYFNIRAGISYYLRGFAAWPAPTFKCRYRTACCNSVQNIPPQFLSLLSLQQFLVIEVSNNDSKGMWFSRSDARCFKSSAWFSRGHNFPYMCLPHFQDACIQVHIRKPSKTYIRNCYFHILPQCVTCFHIVHMFSICSFLYNPIPMYFKVFSCSQIYQTRNSGLGVLDLIIEYFNIFGVPL